MSRHTGTTIAPTKMCPTPKETQTITVESVGPIRHSTTNQQAINTLACSDHSHHGFQTRHIVLFLCMLANTISYTMRTNINMTIVAMVRDDPNKTESDTCLSTDYDSSTPSQLSKSLMSILNHTLSPPSVQEEQLASDGFDWSESLQGTILGAFYYGYIITMAFAGQLADYFGTKKLIFISILGCSICTLAIPLSANLHPYTVIAVRVITGMAQGVVTPALYTILPHWTPKSELGLAFGLIQASGNLGAVITMPICGFLSEYGFAGGWPSVFYVFGSVALLFLAPWFYFVYNSPDEHPRIRTQERVYIKTNLSISANSSGKRKSLVPWRAILTSPKIWAISVTRFCNAWGNLFLMSKLPTYLKSILHMPITYNGYVNASIYIALGGSALIWGYVSDFVERKQWFSRTLSGKLFQSLALCGGAFFLAIIPVAGCNVIAIIILLNLSMFVLGLIAGGENLIVVDVAPDYAGSIYGFTNSIASLPGFLAPLFVGVMLDQSSTNAMQQWNILFWIGSAIYVFGAAVFIFGVNSNPEKWGHAADNLDSMEKSKSDYAKSSSTNQVNIDINNNYSHNGVKHCK